MWQMGEGILPETPEPVSVAQGCRCPCGLCTRLDAEQGDHDWYEPHEPNLRQAGLPWFYFIPTPAKLVPDLRTSYIEESEALWGEEHWQSTR